MAPHATDADDRRPSSPVQRPFKFPDFPKDEPYVSDAVDDLTPGESPMPLLNGLPSGMHSTERWPARKSIGQNRSLLTNGSTHGPTQKTRHGRQKSLSEAIKTVRTRKASISESAHEIADSLKAPVSFRVVAGCVVWYATSILTNTSSKAILTALPKPITLTVVQFLLVSFWCLFLSWLAKHSPALREAAPVLRNGIRRPNMDIIRATLPLTAFQVGGHILNSDAMARIPVSLVHTIKGVSPLMTVVAYRVFYDIRYSTPVYLSLVPLTLGVFMACAANTTSNIVGLAYALGSAILFVTQNIVSKKIFNESAKAEADGLPVSRRKPDKLNLLCYSSAMAFMVTAPIWVFSEGWVLAQDYMHDASITLRERPGSLDHGALAAEFIFNGTFHFGQSLVAFILLGMVSPVTYSVASLIKRVTVIMFSIVWFGNPMTYIQGIGFGFTFLGLYLYDRISDAAKADKMARELGDKLNPLLPLSVSEAKKYDPEPSMTQSPLSFDDLAKPSAGATGYTNGEPVGSGPGRPRGSMGASPAGGTPVNTAYPPPSGTKAEESWHVDNGGTKA